MNEPVYVECADCGDLVETTLTVEFTVPWRCYPCGWGSE
jgi:hypothetical protein